jgi:hypothetical protein
MCARMVQALLEPGQTELNVTCALTPFDTAAESLLPPFVASTGKATVPDDITDKGSCVWALNSSTLTLTATLSVPLVRVPFPPVVGSLEFGLGSSVRLVRVAFAGTPYEHILTGKCTFVGNLAETKLRERLMVLGG